MFRELYKAQKESPAWQAMEAQHADFIEQARVLSGLPDLSIATMFGFHDPLVCDRCTSEALPQTCGMRTISLPACICVRSAQPHVACGSDRRRV